MVDPGLPTSEEFAKFMSNEDWSPTCPHSHPPTSFAKVKNLPLTGPTHSLVYSGTDSKRAAGKEL